MAKMTNNWYREQIKDNLKRCVFERALPADSKANMLEQVATFMADGDACGPRFYVLLFYHLAQHGLRMMSYGHECTNEDIVSIFYRFITRWKADESLRNAAVLAEEL